MATCLPRSCTAQELHGWRVRHGRRDSTHAHIRKRLRELGASWMDTADEGDDKPDGIAGFCGHSFLVECKSAKGKLSDGQSKFARTWRGSPVVVLRSEQEAEAWYLRTREALCREPRRPAAGFVGMVLAALVLATSFVAAQVTAAHLPDSIEQRR